MGEKSPLNKVKYQYVNNIYKLKNMTAKEAREKALWNRLPDIVKEKIMMNVAYGYYECFSISCYEAERRMKRADIKSILEELGYTMAISADNKYYKISWLKYD